MDEWRNVRFVLSCFKCSEKSPQSVGGGIMAGILITAFIIATIFLHTIGARFEVFAIVFMGLSFLVYVTIPPLGVDLKKYWRQQILRIWCIFRTR